MSESVHVFTAENWEPEVLQASTPVLVDFWAAWCGPCRRIAPIVEALANEFTGRVAVGKLNVDEHPEVAARYRILSIPTLLLFRGGQVVEQRVGALPAEELRALLDKQVTETVAS